MVGEYRERAFKQEIKGIGPKKNQKGEPGLEIGLGGPGVGGFVLPKKNRKNRGEAFGGGQGDQGSPGTKSKLGDWDLGLSPPNKGLNAGGGGGMKNKSGRKRGDRLRGFMAIETSRSYPRGLRRGRA